MRVLDLFCCQGGAAAGYAAAGFEVVGVDREPQPRYPFEFHQGDAFEFLREHAHEFDIIHASPPCQAYSPITRDRSAHPDLIPTTRSELAASGKPYIIENVEGARRRMHNPIRLCGSMFDLGVQRHRLFELSIGGVLQRACMHKGTPWGVYGKIERKIYPRPTGGSRGRKAQSAAHASEVLGGVEWMDWYGMTQCVPPSYTRYLGSLYASRLDQRTHPVT